MSSLSFDLSGLFVGEITALAVLHFLALYYFVFASPKPIIGFLDYYVVGPIDTFIRNSRLDQRDFKLNGTLGGGNFGTIYDAIRLKRGEDDSVVNELSEQEEEKRRVIMKRIKRDNLEVRKNFLQAGTMAQGAPRRPGSPRPSSARGSRGTRSLPSIALPSSGTSPPTTSAEASTGTPSGWSSSMRARSRWRTPSRAGSGAPRVP